MKLCIVESTKYSKNNPSGYEEYPNFEDDVWPFFLENKSKILQVYEVKDSSFLCQILNINNPSLLRHGRMSEISETKLAEIKNLSFYSGHLNIIYELTDKEYLQNLIDKWPYKNILQSLDDIPLKVERKEIMNQLIENMSDNQFFISFAHDADPIYVIASEKLIAETFSKSE